MKPIVHVGEGGVSKRVLEALEQALCDHELVKLRLRDTEDRKVVAQQIADKSGAELCGLVGRSSRAATKPSATMTTPMWTTIPPPERPKTPRTPCRDTASTR